MKRLLVTLLLLLIFTTSCSAQPSRSTSPSATPQPTQSTSPSTSPPASSLISPADAKAALEAGNLDGRKVVLVDVREPDEFMSGRIEGAILLSVGSINAATAGNMADKEDAVIVYCRSGRRSASAAAILVELGFRHVYDLGGIQDWPYPTITG